MRHAQATASVVALAAAVLVVTAPLHAQDLCVAVAQAGAPVSIESNAPFRDAFDAPPSETWTTSESARRYRSPDKRERTPKELLEALGSLLDDVRASQALAGAPRLHGRLIAEIALLRTQVDAQAARPVLDLGALALSGGQLSSFRPSSDAARCEGADYSTQTLFFRSGPNAVPVVLSASPIVRSSASAEFPIDQPSPRQYYATLDAAIEFRAVVRVVYGLFEPAIERSLGDVEVRLTRVSAGWQNYLAHGYSQYPWEAFVNSLWGVQWHSAPRTQLVLAHPEPAVVIDLRSSKRSALDGSLLLHGVGLVVYGGARRQYFIGLSATGAVTTEAAYGLGGGATVHVGHAALGAVVPHISIAALAFAGARGRVAPFLGVSADLWRLVQGEGNEPIYRTRAASLAPAE